jgi:hypothetical protein
MRKKFFDIKPEVNKLHAPSEKCKLDARTWSGRHVGTCNAYTDKFFHLNYILFLLKY